MLRFFLLTRAWQIIIILTFHCIINVNSIVFNVSVFITISVPRHNTTLIHNRLIWVPYSYGKVWMILWRIRFSLRYCFWSCVKRFYLYSAIKLKPLLEDTNHTLLLRNSSKESLETFKTVKTFLPSQSQWFRNSW